MDGPEHMAGPVGGASLPQHDGEQSGQASGFTSPEPGPGKVASGRSRRAARTSTSADDELEASGRVPVSQIRPAPRGRGAPAVARSRAAARALTARSTSLRSPRRRLASGSAAWALRDAQVQRRRRGRQSRAAGSLARMVAWAPEVAARLVWQRQSAQAS